MLLGQKSLRFSINRKKRTLLAYGSHELLTCLFLRLAATKDISLSLQQLYNQLLHFLIISFLFDFLHKIAKLFLNTTGICHLGQHKTNISLRV